MADDGTNTTVSEAVLRALFESPLKTLDRLREPDRVVLTPTDEVAATLKAAQAGTETALDEAYAEARLARLNGVVDSSNIVSGGAGERVPVGQQGSTAEQLAETKARFAAYLQSLTPNEFLFQASRAGFFGIGSGISPDPTSIYSGLFADEIARRIRLQQITPQGTLVQPIGPRTDAPVTPPVATAPIGPGIGAPVGPGRATGDGSARPGGGTPALPTSPGIGLPVSPPRVTGDGSSRPVRPIGPGIVGTITVPDGIASGTARTVNPDGSLQPPPGALRPPPSGSGGTGQPPGLGQAFPDGLFARNPPDP